MTIEFGEKTTVYTGEHISVIEQGFSCDGKAGMYEMVVRNKVSGIVSVLPITKDNEVVLIRQFRIPLGYEVIEQAAGLNDKAGETNMDAAKRELIEETGYVSEDIEYIMDVPTSSGLTNERITCYVAKNCRKVSDILTLDTAESMSVFILPVDSALWYLYQESRKGNLVDSKVFMMLQWYLAFAK